MPLQGAPISLVVNSDEQKLIRSLSNPVAYVVPRLFQGDTPAIEFQLLRRSDVSANALVVVPAVEYSLQVILVDSTGIQLAYQNSFADDVGGQVKTGTISLSTTEINTALEAETEVTAYLQIKCSGTDGSTRTAFFIDSIKINKNYLSSSAVVAPPTETAATESWVRGTFFPKSGTSGGDVKVMQSEGGYQFRFYVDDDGVPHFDRIT